MLCICTAYGSYFTTSEVELSSDCEVVDDDDDEKNLRRKSCVDVVVVGATTIGVRVGIAERTKRHRSLYVDTSIPNRKTLPIEFPIDGCCCDPPEECGWLLPSIMARIA